MDQLSMFAGEATHRRSDLETSVAAAEVIRGKLSDIQRRVLTAFAAAGPLGLTDRELEQLEPFRMLAPSTARKRRSELYQGGYIRLRMDANGHPEKRNGLAVWVLP